MKTYVELSLVAVLIVLLYQPPTAVIDFAKSGLGKAVLIISIVAISHQFGMNAGLLSAIIGIKNNRSLNILFGNNDVLL